MVAGASKIKTICRHVSSCHCADGENKHVVTGKPFISLRCRPFFSLSMHAAAPSAVK
jgi:hypothetical protein